MSIDYINTVFEYILYHQAVSAGFQSAETDAEQNSCGEGVVVDKATTLGVTVMTIQCQVCVGVAGEQYGTEVDLQGDGLNPAVYTDVPLTWRTEVAVGTCWRVC